MHDILKKIIVLLIFVSMVLPSCKDRPQQAVVPAPEVISVKIIPDQEPGESTGNVTLLSSSLGDAALSPTVPKVEENPVVLEPGQLLFYSSTGKIDPFMPLIQTESKVVTKVDAVEDKPQRILTPLEKIDLSQIRLVAVVQADSGNIAMVEEGSGKGYVIGIGTYMGKNGGRVEKILKDRVVIKEIVKDFRGDAVPRSMEMILHKQEIEG